MSKYQWQEHYYPMVFGAVFVGFLAAITISAITDKYFGLSSCFVYVLLWGVITIAILYATSRSFGRTAVSRFVLTDEATARQVVANVLSAKTWPFEQTEKGFQ